MGFELTDGEARMVCRMCDLALSSLPDPKLLTAEQTVDLARKVAQVRGLRERLLTHDAATRGAGK